MDYLDDEDVELYEAPDGADDDRDYEEDYDIVRKDDDDEKDEGEDGPVVIEDTPGEDKEEPVDEEGALEAELEALDATEDLMERQLPEAAAKITTKLTKAPVEVRTGADRKSRNILTKYERARVIGARARHIEKNSAPMIDVGKVIDPVIIARMELDAKKLPIWIRRRMPDGSIEEWDPNTMIFFT